MIIVAAKNKFDKSKQSEEFRYCQIDYKYMIDLKQSIQFEINDTEK